jgi:hypothetical protein
MSPPFGSDAASASGTKLPPDIAEVQRFLRILDPDPAAQSGFATVDDRRGDGGSDPRLGLRIFGTPDQGVRLTGRKRGQACRPFSMLAFMQSLGAGVFITVQELDGAGADAACVVRIRAFIADGDSPEQVESLWAFIRLTGLVPTMLIASGGIARTADGRIVEKLHAYWRVSDCPVDRFSEAQAVLISRTGTDPSVRDLARVLRVPGFWHLKSEPRMTRIVGTHDVTYEFNDFIARVQAAPAVMQPPRPASAGTRRPAATGPRLAATERLRTMFERFNGLVKPAVRELVREIGAEGSGRHDAVVAIAGRLVLQRWTVEQAVSFLAPIVNDAFGEGDWTGEIVAALAHARRREAERLSGMKGVRWK